MDHWYFHEKDKIIMIKLAQSQAICGLIQNKKKVWAYVWVSINKTWLLSIKQTMIKVWPSSGGWFAPWAQ